MKKLIKILSVFLAVLTFFSILSAATPVFATEVNEYIADKEYTEKLLTEVVENDTEEKAPIVKEIEEKREENKKVYLREDGTYTAVISKTPVHYEKDGEWVDIVNDLKTDGDIIKNIAGNFNVEFPKEISEEDEIKIENGKESITFSMVETEKSNGKVKNNKKQKQDKSKVSDEEIFNNDISRTVSKIEYEDVLGNTNLEYVVTSTGIKENIIVENKESLKKSYSFNITKGNLKAELDKENNLYFKNSKGEVVFTIPAPVMTDSNGAISYDIEVKVKNLKKETITLTYTPDKKWLNDKDRVYPVVIDPVIMLESDKEHVIEDTAIAIDTTDAEIATKNYCNDFIASVMYVSGKDENNVLQTLKYDVLVKLNMDIFSVFKTPDIVVTDVCFVMEGNATNGNILAKEISGSWDSTTITGADVYPQLAGSNNSATISYSSNILDYCSGVDSQTENSLEILSFNITNLFQDWLYGKKTNNGFVLTTEDNGCAALSILGGKYTNSKGKTTYYDSYCVVDYIEAGGYNSEFEYISQDIGRAGTFNVNTFTRSLSAYREDLSMSGNRMAVNLAFNYNSALSGFTEWQRNFDSAYDEENYTLYSPYGDNWSPNYLKCITTIDDTQYFYFTETGSIVVFNVSEDEDGNVIFEPDKNSESGYELSFYEDEDKSEESDDGFHELVIITPTGEIECFDEDGRLIEIRDPELNSNGVYDKITITYDDYTTLEPDYYLPKIKCITDGANRTYNFGYTNDKLTSVTCKSSSGAVIYAGTTTTPLKTTYAYTNNNLTQVSYPTENATADPMKVTYAYDSSGNLTNAKNVDGYNIIYTYDALGKVTEIAEYANGDEGNYITLTQGSGNCVKINDAYSGENTYLFSKSGELLYTLDDKGNYYKNASGFSLNDDSTEDMIITDSSWRVIPENLLKNSSFEAQYLTSSTRANSWNSYFVRTSAVSHTGAYSYLVNSTSNISRFNQQTVNVSANESYTLSAYVKSATTGVLTLRIVEINSSNTQTITKTLTISNTDDWERFSTSFKTKSDTVALNVMFGFNNNKGCYYIDTLQLEKGLGTAAYNYVDNNSFIDTTSCWSGDNTSLSVINETINGDGVKALKLPSCMPYFTIVSDDESHQYDKVSSATQTITINGKKGEVYSIGSWFKGDFADGLLSENTNNAFGVAYIPLAKRAAQIKASYTYTDENGESQNVDFAVNFQPGVDAWQYASESFALKGDVTTVNVTVITQNLCTDTYFTKVSLTKDEDAIVISDDETDTASVATIDTTGDDTTVGCLCEDCEDLDCTCTCTDTTTCTCVPCTRRSNIEATSTDGKTVTTQMYDGTYYLQSATTYSDDLNYIASETDENNISTSYKYNANDNGVITSLTNGTNETEYDSNAKGYLSLAKTEVSGLSDGESDVSLTFSYKNDALSTVIANDVAYSYTYDVWGQTKSVSVDNQKLVQYNYGNKENRSRINSIEYIINTESNTKHSLNYIYDEYGNVTQVIKRKSVNGVNDEIVYSYYYDNLGKLLFIDDSNTGRTIHYSDDGGITIDATGVGDYSYQSSYNDDGEFSETINGVTYTAKNYDDSYDASSGNTTSKEAIVTSNNKTFGVETLTDWFGRTKTTTVMTKDPTDDETEYPAKIRSNRTFISYDSNKTTNLIKNYTNQISGVSGSRTANFIYAYDTNGRIISRRTAGTLSALVEMNTYAYDEAGQLVRENKSTQKTWVYEYDSNGNITKRKAYNYTVAGTAPTTLVSTDTFTYATGTWEDRLVSYNGQSIVYDNIGNPTTYLGATLTWHGRELLDYTKGTKSYQFSYDVDGMRYQKVVKTNGSETARYNYVYADGQLILLKYTANGVTNNAKFIYDSAGEVRGFVVNGTTQYLYVKNPQGDISAIVNESGVPVVRYIYDAWGNTTITSDSGYDYLASLSPFAYRGYCYDNDMKMYYLQSRYYDPQICRFINADSSEYLGATETVLSYNLFAYCENDPVNCVDATGCYKCYAFAIDSNTSQSTKVNKASKLVVKMGASTLKKVTYRKNFKIYETNNASSYAYVTNKNGFYIDYRFMGNSLTRNTLTRAVFVQKKYLEWLIYIESRHSTVFDLIENKVRKATGMSEEDWEIFSLALGDCEFPDALSYVKTGLVLYDVLKLVLHYLKKWLDKQDNYILYCLESFPKLKNSNKKIAILWYVDEYKYGYANSGTGYRTGWHLQKRAWGYKY